MNRNLKMQIAILIVNCTTLVCQTILLLTK